MFKVTHLLGVFFTHSFLCFELLFKQFFFMFFFLLRLMTPISLALPMLFPLPLIILPPSWLLCGWSFSFANVWFGPLQVWFVGLPSQFIFVALLMALGLRVLVPSLYPFCKRLWMKMLKFSC